MNIPAKLYKYQPCVENALNNLQQRCIWFSKRECFNDPFDCDINFSITDITEDNLSRLYNYLRDSSPNNSAFDAKYSQNGKFINKFKEDIIEKTILNTDLLKVRWAEIGIACFTEENNNILMWSHYANGHQGFCLEFDTKLYPFKSTDKKSLLKIMYSENYPPLSLTDIPDNLPSITQDQLGIKSLNWQYEKEWRMFSNRGNACIKYENGALSGIYFGCKINADDKKNIINILSGTQTKLYQMEKSKDQFILEPKTIQIV
jgi:hypothetical protein